MTHTAFEKDMLAYNRLSTTDKMLANKEAEKVYSHRNLVYAICRTMRLPSMADDILQHVAAKASTLKFAHASGNEKYYCNLIRKTATNLLFDEMRRCAIKRLVSVENYDCFEDYSRHSDNPAIRAVHQDLLREVDKTLNQMAKESEARACYVKIYRQRVFDQMPPLDIARHEVIDRGDVDTAVSRVRERLAKALK